VCKAITKSKQQLFNSEYLVNQDLVFIKKVSLQEFDIFHIKRVCKSPHPEQHRVYTPETIPWSHLPSTPTSLSFYQIAVSKQHRI